MFSFQTPELTFHKSFNGSVLSIHRAHSDNGPGPEIKRPINAGFIQRPSISNGNCVTIEDTFNTAYPATRPRLNDNRFPSTNLKTFPLHSIRQLAMFQFLKMWVVRIFSFVYRSVRRFKSNNGLLLSAAVSYKTLLSFIPLVALLVVGLSFVFPEEKLLEIIRQQVNHVLPGQVDAVLEVAETFLRTRDLVSGIGILMLLFFSSIGFRVLRDAVKSIFHEKEHRTRRYWITFLIPYMYIGALGLALFAITIFSVLLEELREDGISLFGYVWQFEAAPGFVVHALAFLGLLLIFTSLYKVLPVRSVSLKRAFIGGSVAALLWDVTRRGLVFYFNHLSMINVLYGSLATVIVILVSLEIAAGIVLYGAQVTADLEDNASAGNHWYESPDGTY